MFEVNVKGPRGPKGKWQVVYEINGEEHEAFIDDGSTNDYHGHSPDAFEDYIAQTHPNVSMDDVEVVSSISADHPLASFF